MGRFRGVALGLQVVRADGAALACRSVQAPFTLHSGRKKYLFSGSDQGERRLNDIDPEAWLADAPDAIAGLVGQERPTLGRRHAPTNAAWFSAGGRLS